MQISAFRSSIWAFFAGIGSAIDLSGRLDELETRPLSQSALRGDLENIRKDFDTAAETELTRVRRGETDQYQLALEEA